ncbi:MAG: MerR family transcriptional regulator [Firmicutes bacterium HGW-Firmicutes-9]|jgi:DNA-binding transcriptional MerR regulator/DNA-directed RNA polymerase subunit RPC12/RpoP|nr:MAG: MerR family transcriptional regulator [Firmicutes bacterium HGW-Firmicutes-9]
MADYSTGELARLCGITVRTVQFYDAKGLLHPADLSEGGRRLYSDSDLRKMRMICALKTIGLTLDAIRGILASEKPESVLILLLEEQERRIADEKDALERQKRAVDTVRETIRTGQMITIESIADMDRMMEEKHKLNQLHLTILALAMGMSGLQWASVIYWITTGIWWPFVAIWPLVIATGVYITRMYYLNTLYICPECGARFRPPLREMFWAYHTPKTRKLTCTKCNTRGWCVETYGKTE